MQLGLDFGTTNSAVAFLGPGGVQVLPIGTNGARTVRSVLYFPDEEKGYYAGDDAILRYVESGMQGRFLQSVKSLLPDPGFQGTLIPGFGKQEAHSLAAKIIWTIRKRAMELLGRDLTQVVIGRPAEFSEIADRDTLAEERLIAAAKEAGFRDVSLQLEPIAAALHYEASLDHDELVLVADFGGGTSDFTVMRVGPKRRQERHRTSDILASAGVYIGGDRFDSEIMSGKLLAGFGAGSTFASIGKTLPFPIHILMKLKKWQLIPFLKDKQTRQTIREVLQSSSNPGAIRRLRELIEQNLGFALFRSIEKAKVALTSADVAEITFQEHDISIREQLRKGEFESLIAEPVAEFAGCIDRVLRAAGVTAADIDTVFVTGGTSLVPMVRRRLAQRFGPERIRSADTFTSVAAGLALSGR